MGRFSFWRGVSAVAGLVCVIGPTPLAASRPGAEARVTFTPVAWEANFRRALHAPWATVNIIALSPTTPTRLLLCVNHGDRSIYLWRERERRRLGKAGKSGEGIPLPPMPGDLTASHPEIDLWLADPDGSHARFLHQFKGCVLNSVGWSPDGQELLSQFTPFTPDNQPHDSQIQVLNLKSRKSWQIADRNEEMPSWGANSRTLFFWRKLADATVTPEGNVTAYARRQLLRAEAPWEKPTVHLATKTVLSAPSALSPDGARLLYITLYRDPGDGTFRLGPPVVESLATGQVEPLLPHGGPLPARHPDDTEFPYPAPLWSGDSHWMFHTASQRFGGMNTMLYDLKSSEQTDMNPLLNAWADTVLKRTSEERVHIESAGWLAPDDNRLLLEIGTSVFHGDFGAFPLNSPPPKHGWVVYDPVERKLSSVEGLPKERGPFAHYLLVRAGAHYGLIGMSAPLTNPW